MTKKLSAAFENLLYEATLKSFWRKKALRRFLSHHKISESFINSWADESKREFLDRLFSKLPKAKNGQSVMLTMARDLAEQTGFPDLKGWEDSQEKILDAREAIAALKTALEKLNQEVVSERERQSAQERLRTLQTEAKRSQDSLQKLDERLKGLSLALGTQQAGYDFQDWFYDLMDFFEVLSRRPYTTQGRQIDGSVTISGTTYLVELKFTGQQAGAPDIDVFYKKVTGKAENTMGIFVSISGYSSTAIKEASGSRTPLLLLDHSHLYLALGGIMTFPEIVDRVRRHASQTGESFLLAADMGS